MRLRAVLWMGVLTHGHRPTSKKVGQKDKRKETEQQEVRGQMKERPTGDEEHKSQLIQNSTMSHRRAAGAEGQILEMLMWPS